MYDDFFFDKKYPILLNTCFMNKINIFKLSMVSSSSGGPTKTVLSLSKCLNNKVNLEIISNEIFKQMNYLKRFKNLKIK